jgi:hypothetical protein
VANTLKLFRNGAVGCIDWLGSSSPVVWGVARAFQVTRINVECCRDERFVKARRVNAKNFFAELKRRNVYKVAIAYAVVAWLLMQIATQCLQSRHRLRSCGVAADADSDAGFSFPRNSELGYSARDHVDHHRSFHASRERY